MTWSLLRRALPCRCKDTEPTKIYLSGAFGYTSPLMPIRSSPRRVISGHPRLNKSCTRGGRTTELAPPRHLCRRPADRWTVTSVAKSGSQISRADFMDIAAGDLDKLPDSAGDNHDEVVVAYASPGANNQLMINVAVLDYTAPATAPPSPVAVTTAQASTPLTATSSPRPPTRRASCRWTTCSAWPSATSTATG